ncbi:MAG: S8 family serine peptidase [Acidobacteriota bacterium]
MARFVRFAVVVWLAVLCFAAEGRAANRLDLVSTRCREVEVPLDATHSSARLADCGDDSAEDLLWHLDRIDHPDGQLEGTFDRTNRGQGSVVYVMDTGVRADHTEFSSASGSRVVAGFDATRSIHIGNSRCARGNKALDPCYTDFNELAAASHGTGVASLIAGHTVGVASEALIVSVRVMNEHGLATTRTYLDGLDAIIEHAWSPAAPRYRTAVVNISGWVLERISQNDPVPTISYATIERKMRDMTGGVDASGRPDARGKRFLFVVAGNNLDGGCNRAGFVDRFPAILGPEIDGVITVGGMTAANGWWAGACRGGVEVLAPAQSIFSATITGRDHYRGKKPNLRSGTSFSAPMISGIAALLLAESPELTPQQLEAIITTTSSRITDPDFDRADGKVACVEPRPAPTFTASMHASGFVSVPGRMLESER